MENANQACRQEQRMVCILCQLIGKVIVCLVISHNEGLVSRKSRRFSDP